MDSVAKTVCLFLVLLALISTCLGDDKRLQWLRHSGRVSAFACESPQPRTVYLEDLLPEDKIPLGKIIPASTVLHKCENAGCCSNKFEKCKAIAFKEVNLVFGVLRKKSISYLEVTARNHTQCGCQDSANKPK